MHGLTAVMQSIAKQQIRYILFECLLDGVYLNFQQYFSYIVAVSFIGGIPNVAEQNLLILEEEKQI
jgi:hypothetical protein